MHNLFKKHLIVFFSFSLMLSSYSKAEVFSSVTSFVSGITQAMDITDKVSRLDKHLGADEKDYSKFKSHVVFGISTLIMTLMVGGFTYDKYSAYRKSQREAANKAVEAKHKAELLNEQKQLNNNLICLIQTLKQQTNPAF